MIHPRVLTTSRESAEKKGRERWLGFLPARDCLDRSATYVFTDGSSKGSFAAIFVSGSEPSSSLEEHVGWKEPTETRNMGAEWNGLLLGLEKSPQGSKIVVVSDLLWLGAWMVGARRAEHPETIAALAKGELLVSERGLDARFVHHEGHQNDDSDFSIWNRRADELCKQKAKQATAGGQK